MVLNPPSIDRLPYSFEAPEYELWYPANGSKANRADRVPSALSDSISLATNCSSIGWSAVSALSSAGLLGEKGKKGTNGSASAASPHLQLECGKRLKMLLTYFYGVLTYTAPLLEKELKKIMLPPKDKLILDSKMDLLKSQTQLLKDDLDILPTAWSPPVIRGQPPTMIPAEPALELLAQLYIWLAEYTEKTTLQTLDQIQAYLETMFSLFLRRGKDGYSREHDKIAMPACMFVIKTNFQNQTSRLVLGSTGAIYTKEALREKFKEARLRRLKSGGRAVAGLICNRFPNPPATYAQAMEQLEDKYPRTQSVVQPSSGERLGVSTRMMLKNPPPVTPKNRPLVIFENLAPMTPESLAPLTPENAVPDTIENILPMTPVNQPPAVTYTLSLTAVASEISLPGSSSSEVEADGEAASEKRPPAEPKVDDLVDARDVPEQSSTNATQVPGEPQDKSQLDATDPASINLDSSKDQDVQSSAKLGKSAAQVAAKTRGQSPTKSGAQSPAKPGARSPTKQGAQSPTKQGAQSPTKTGAQSPTKGKWKPPGNSRRISDNPTPLSTPKATKSSVTSKLSDKPTDQIINGIIIQPAFQKTNQTAVAAAEQPNEGQTGQPAKQLVDQAATQVTVQADTEPVRSPGNPSIGPYDKPPIDPPVNSSTNRSLDLQVSATANSAVTPFISLSVDPSISIGSSAQPPVDPQVSSSVISSVSPFVGPSDKPPIDPPANPLVDTPINPPSSMPINSSTNLPANPSVGPSTESSISPPLNPAVKLSVNPPVKSSSGPSLGSPINLPSVPSPNPSMKTSIGTAVNPPSEPAATAAANPAANLAVDSVAVAAINPVFKPAVNMAVRAAVEPITKLTVSGPPNDAITKEMLDILRAGVRPLGENFDCRTHLAGSFFTLPIPGVIRDGATSPFFQKQARCLKCRILYEYNMPGETEAILKEPARANPALNCAEDLAYAKLWAIEWDLRADGAI